MLRELDEGGSTPGPNVVPPPTPNLVPTPGPSFVKGIKPSVLGMVAGGVMAVVQAAKKVPDVISTISDGIENGHSAIADRLHTATNAFERSEAQDDMDTLKSISRGLGKIASKLSFLGDVPWDGLAKGLGVVGAGVSFYETYTDERDAGRSVPTSAIAAGVSVAGGLALAASWGETGAELGALGGPELAVVGGVVGAVAGGIVGSGLGKMGVDLVADAGDKLGSWVSSWF
jgi:hypothetical protein